MRFLFVVFLLSLAGCQSKPIDLGNRVDLNGFRSDRGGCNSIRTEMTDDIIAVKDLLLSHSENELLATLGRYDFQIIDRKNEKVFIYYLEAGPHCEHIQNESSALSMAVYLNSVSLVKEITFQQGKP